MKKPEHLCTDTIDAIIKEVIVMVPDPDNPGQEIPQVVVKPKTAADLARLIDVQIKLFQFKFNLIGKFGDPVICEAVQRILNQRAEEGWSAQCTIEQFAKMGVPPPDYIVKQFSKELEANIDGLPRENGPETNLMDDSNSERKVIFIRWPLNNKC